MASHQPVIAGRIGAFNQIRNTRRQSDRINFVNKEAALPQSWRLKPAVQLKAYDHWQVGQDRARADKSASHVVQRLLNPSKPAARLSTTPSSTDNTRLGVSWGNEVALTIAALNARWLWGSRTTYGLLLQVGALTGCSDIDGRVGSNKTNVYRLMQP
ncbi:hypothetical protein BC835DRAFT_1305679 [Cytidiella melzeri]|nr:hypothetical protein BC835DRAFT_1305679 [Cytidiella melzeri]